MVALTEDERRAVLLLHDDGMTSNDIALAVTLHRAFGIPEDNIVRLANLICDMRATVARNVKFQTGK